MPPRYGDGIVAVIGLEERRPSPLFLLNGRFDDIEFYQFYVDQS